MASESLEYFFASLKWDLWWAFLSNGSLLATLQYRRDLWSACDIVVACTQWPVFAVKACSSFKVAIGLLVASLISHLLAWTSSLKGRPDLGRVLVVPYTFYFLRLCSKEYSRPLKFFLYPSPDLSISSTLFRRSFESSLVLMVESLSSRGNLQEQPILFWNWKGTQESTYLRHIMPDPW